jgi:hypothetical protein
VTLYPTPSGDRVCFVAPAVIKIWNIFVGDESESKILLTREERTHTSRGKMQDGNRRTSGSYSTLRVLRCDVSETVIVKKRILQCDEIQMTPNRKLTTKGDSRQSRSDLMG